MEQAIIDAIEQMSQEQLLKVKNHIERRLSIKNTPTFSLKNENKLSTGDSITWRGKNGESYLGIIIRVNQKTYTVKKDDATEWRIPCHLLSKISSSVTIKPKIALCEVCNEKIDNYFSGCKVCAPCAAKNATFVTYK